MTRKIRHFTLVELLVVMGLISLLVGLAVPTFLNLAKGKTTPIAAEEVKRQLEEAQAIAITNHAYVGLIIPNGSATYYGSAFTTDDSPDFSKSSMNQYYLGSSRPALLFKDGSDYYFDKWAPGSSWSKPLENAKIVKLEKSQNSLVNKEKELTGAASSVTDSLDKGYSTWSFKGIIPTGKTSALGPCAVVFSPDGGLVATYDLYVVVAGCQMNGSNFELNKGKTDYSILHISRMDGTISYFEVQ